MLCVLYLSGAVPRNSLSQASSPPFQVCVELELCRLEDKGLVWHVQPCNIIGFLFVVNYITMCHYRVINVIQTPGPETLCLVIKGSCFRQIITNWSLCFVASGQSVNMVCELSIALVSTTQTIQTTQWMTQAHLMPVAVSEQLQMNERGQNRRMKEREQ